MLWRSECPITGRSSLLSKSARLKQERVCGEHGHSNRFDLVETGCATAQTNRRRLGGPKCFTHEINYHLATVRFSSGNTSGTLGMRSDHKAFLPRLLSTDSAPVPTQPFTPPFPYYCEENSWTNARAQLLAGHSPPNILAEHDNVFVLSGGSSWLCLSRGETREEKSGVPCTHPAKQAGLARARP